MQKIADPQTLITSVNGFRRISQEVLFRLHQVNEEVLVNLSQMDIITLGVTAIGQQHHLSRGRKLELIVFKI